MVNPITITVDGIDVTVQPQNTGEGPSVIFLAPPVVIGSGNDVNLNTGEPSNSKPFPGPDDTTCHYVAKPANGKVWIQVSSATDLSIVKVCQHT